MFGNPTLLKVGLLMKPAIRLCFGKNEFGGPRIQERVTSKEKISGEKRRLECPRHHFGQSFGQFPGPMKLERLLGNVCLHFPNL